MSRSPGGSGSASGRSAETSSNGAGRDAGKPLENRWRRLRRTSSHYTRVRKLIEVDLWEISIVTFPLLSGARVRAKGACGEDERLLRRHPRLSFTRTRAEREWSRAAAS